MIAPINQNHKPNPLPVILDNIPETLRAKRRWVLWRYENQGERWTKVLYNANVFCDLVEHKKASSTDSRTWAFFDTVADLYRNHGAEVDGIGFCLVPADGIVGIDCDHVVGTDNERAMLKMATYAERSPSGTGLRLIGLGTLPENRGRKSAWLELYNSGRYLTITGQRLNDHDARPIQRDVDGLLARFFKTEAPPATVRADVSLEDEEILELALSHDHSGKFSALWYGDEQAIIDMGCKKDTGELDHSRADCVLLMKLAFYTRDVDQLERLFAASKLGEYYKWARPKYRQRTIDYALAHQSETYSADADRDAAVAAVVGHWDIREDDKVNWLLKGTYNGIEMARRAKNSKRSHLFADLCQTAGITLLSGLPYSGKSLIVLQLMRALALGLPFYGKACLKPQTPTIYINADNAPDETFYSRLAELCGDDSDLMTVLPYLQFTESRDLPATVNGDFLRRLVHGMREEHKAETVLVVIDTLRPAFLLEQGAGAENDSSLITQLLSPVRALSVEENVCVLLLHHNAKSTDRTAGSAAIAGNTEAVWTITKRGEHSAFIKVESRSGNLNLDVALGRAPVTTTDVDHLLDFIDKFDPVEGKTREEAAAMFPDLSMTTLRRMLEDAQRAGKHPRLERLGTGIKGDPFKFIRV